MKTMTMFAALVIAGIATASAVQDAAKPTVVVKAADAKWGDHPFVKGGKLCVMSGDPHAGNSVLMMQFPKGMTIPAHWHTSDEVVTVVSGLAIFGAGEVVDAAKGTEVGPGSYAVIPGKNPHWAIVKEDLVITVTMNLPADFHACGEKK